MPAQDEVIERTAAAIIASIEQGLADPAGWRAPWHDADPAALTAYNPATSKNYTAGNRFVLALVSMETGCPSHWATFKQWQSIGAQVRKGEHAAARIIRPAIKSEELPDGTTRDRVIAWRAYPVFHAGQVDGYDMPAPIERTPAEDRPDRDAAFMFAAAIGARVNESETSGAFYSPTFDEITMPERDRFTDAHGVWSTLTHELTHWTGHESRLARTFGKRFGDDAYAAEELCAELGAAFTLATLGRTSEPREDHARYLAHWLRVLKADASHLWHVMSQAEKASALLVERAAILPESVAA